MKTKFASVLLAGFVGIAATSSASATGMNERPDSFRHGVMADQTKTVKAGQIYSAKELTRSGYDADSKVEVTVFTSTGKIDKSSAGD